MKKASILLLFVCALSLNACAQWYLFPGKKKPTDPKPTVTDTVRHTRPDTTATRAGADTLAITPADSTQLPPTVPEDVFVLDIPDVIHIGLALPLQASAQRPSDNFLDFYSGALLALRDLGGTGLRADLQVYDTADSKTSVPQSLLDENDVLIGPVSFEELQRTAPLCGSKVLVSPLEPKAVSLAAEGAVVQAPPSWTAQTDELVRWIREELPVGEPLYVVRDTASLQLGEQSAYLMAQLQEKGIRYQSVLSASAIPFDKNRKAHVAVASDRDNFITTAVRSLSIEGARNNDVILYGTSRMRTNGVAQTDLHNTEAHLTLSYFIDYDDPAVQRFILAYRALFQTEPGSFAFQGYDTMHYFVTMCAKYGRQWHKKLPEYGEKGLQADFRFREEPARINQAVRRVFYHADLTTTKE